MLMTNISVLLRPRFRRAFSQSDSIVKAQRTSHSQNGSIKVVRDNSKCTNDTHKHESKHGKRKTRSGTRRGTICCRGSMPKMRMDPDGNDYSSSSESLPCPGRRRRRRAATMHDSTHKLKTAVAFVSSIDNERVKLLGITQTPSEVCVQLYFSCHA